MAVVKSIKNKKSKREWLKNLLFIIHFQTKFFKIFFKKILIFFYNIKKLNIKQQSNKKKQSIIIFFINGTF